MEEQVFFLFDHPAKSIEVRRRRQKVRRKFPCGKRGGLYPGSKEMTRVMPVVRRRASRQGRIGGRGKRRETMQNGNSVFLIFAAPVVVDGISPYLSAFRHARRV
ncbi:MAG: hypothetical protein LBI87_01050 [Candidatus Accumulibacter sp.]|nr:hypothetical protein [Accumulibacter sp.]